MSLALDEASFVTSQTEGVDAPADVSTVMLTDRPRDAVLFRLPGRNVTAGQFAADALRLADALPHAPYAINICNGRYAFAVGFAAALLRGLPSLLTSDRSLARLAGLAARYPGAVTIADAEQPGWNATLVPGPGHATTSSPAIAAGQCAAIVFTSGSTGEPVAHAKLWGALAARSRSAGLAFSLAGSAPVSVVGMVPPQHMYGFETTILLPLHAAASAWCGPTFYPADIRAAAETLPGPLMLVTTPLQLRTLLSDGTALPPLQRIVSATAPLDPAVAQAAEQRWATEVWEIFGATEVGSIASRRTTAGPGWAPYPCVRLTNAPLGLVVEAEAAVPTVLDDAVHLLACGGFELIGRRADVVKLGGHRASLAGLNQVLTAVTGVDDGVFVPPTDGEHGGNARMTAVVVAPDASAAAILTALRGQIDPLFLPRRIVHVDRLPRNELGKLSATAVRALVAGQPA